MFSEAIVLRFKIYSSECAWLATILDSSPVISMFYFCIILTWSNYLVFYYWFVSTSYCTLDANFSCSFGEWAITCFWLITIFQDKIFQLDRHHTLWLQQSDRIITWPFLLTIAWFLPPYLLSRVSFFLLERFVYYCKTICVLFWNTFRLVTHHHCQLCCWQIHHSLLSFQNQPIYRRCGLNLSLLYSRT